MKKKFYSLKEKFISNFDRNKIISIIISLILITILIVLEQVSKLIARQYLIDGETKNIIPKILDFNIVYNKGAGYSIFSNNYSLLIFFTIIGLLFVSSLLYFVSFKNKKTFTIASILIISGAFSNSIDRFFMKKGVTDFIEFPFLKAFKFGNFTANLADIYISIGFVLMVVSFIISAIINIKKNKKEQDLV